MQDNSGNVMNVEIASIKQAILAKKIQIIGLELKPNGSLCAVKKKDYTKTVPEKLLIPSLYGVQIKNLKSYIGREGVTMYGTVYYNGVRLGHWAQDPNGAICDDFEFNTQLIDVPYNKYLSNNPKYDSIECFMTQILVVLGNYKFYKKRVKEGYNTVIAISDKYDMSVTYISTNGKDKQKILRDNEKEISQYLKQYGEDSKYEIFTSEADFCIS